MGYSFDPNLIIIFLTRNYHASLLYLQGLKAFEDCAIKLTTLFTILSVEKNKLQKKKGEGEATVLIESTLGCRS